MSGWSVEDNNIGSNEKDKRTETNINKSTFIGLLRFKRSWPSPTKKKVITI